MNNAPPTPAAVSIGPGLAAPGRTHAHIHTRTRTRTRTRTTARFAALACAAALLTLAGCATGPAGLVIDTSHSAVGQDSRVQYLILHFTDEDFASSLRILTQQKVSSHYLVSDASPPRVYRLVDENRRAWHAGLSRWKNDAGLNASSVGIEIVNLGPRPQVDGRQDFSPYPPAQIDLVVALVKDIVARHQIKPENVLGHSDIAPQRKIDPGPRFPWKRLADEGLVRWPDARLAAAMLPVYQARLPDVAWFQQSLATVGYDVPRHGELDQATQRVLSAFQMKYRPADHSGQPDAETAALLQALTASANR